MSVEATVRNSMRSCRFSQINISRLSQNFDNNFLTPLGRNTLSIPGFIENSLQIPDGSDVNSPSNINMKSPNRNLGSKTPSAIKNNKKR